MRRLVPAQAALAVLCACAEPPATVPPDAIALRVDARAEVARIDERFLSVAVDTSQVVGGFWWSDDVDDVEGGLGSSTTEPFDFARPRLRRLAAALAPFMLRVGGSEADKTFFAPEAAYPATPPEGYAHVLTGAQWDGIVDFARALDAEIFFTLNAGPGARDDQGAWTGENARVLLQHAVAADAPVSVWELGNEINGFLVIHGPDGQVSGEQYAADVAAARALVDELDPDALLAGPSSAFWPTWGELAPIMPSFMPAGGRHLDVVTWHYYPQQSARCPIAVRRAEPYLMLEPENLDEVAVWAAAVEDMAAEHAPQAEVWLGETGHAQCGGEPGVSSRFVASLWWLDQLGLVARRGQRAVVRQTLSGSDYGLLDDDLRPRPDFFASVLWKGRMGERVLDVEAAEHDRRTSIRAYAHCARGLDGAVAVLALNIDRFDPLPVSLPGLDGRGGLVWNASADDLLSDVVLVNGAPAGTTDEGDVTGLSPALVDVADDGTASFTLAPGGYAFVVLPRADAAACR